MVDQIIVFPVCSLFHISDRDLVWEISWQMLKLHFFVWLVVLKLLFSQYLFVVFNKDVFYWEEIGMVPS